MLTLNATKPILLGVLVMCSYASTAQQLEMPVEGIGTITVHVKAFEAPKHTVKKCGDYVCLIDGKPFFGSDGKVPTREISKIVFSTDGGATELDVSSMYNPAVNKSNLESRITVKPYWGEFYKITGRFSDGSGSYVAQWIASADGSIRIHISDRESLYELHSEVFEQ